MKKSFAIINIFLFTCIVSTAQQKATVREYIKSFKTYPFSDPDPVPEPGRIYPYYRFDGYTNSSIQKNWKVVELENSYIKVMILPEIGGKIWAAIEKKTGKSFVYYNHVVKFRDVAMRGPWTSGGIEPNYGIIGHTPNCATPVDYTTIQKTDGSASCVIGVLDLLTRTIWRIDINLPADKAYFTTNSFWYNASAIEQPYYTWMNTGIKAAGNLQFIYPGTKYLGHEGEYSDWPINKQNGKDISFYNNNDFGGYKSYHVFGKYTDFFGGYWHDEDFGMGRYSTHDDKPGKKIWIWGLSQQGMIWEKLLTDTDGQYVEVQSGRLFNQSADNSTFTPFKHKGFLPHTTDVWTEYWFPVIKTKGFVSANNFGALNIKHESGLLKIYFSPLQKINDDLIITAGGKIIYSKSLKLNPLQTFADSIKMNTSGGLLAILGKDKIKYEEEDSANILSRPVQTPADFDWNSTYGLYLQGKEKIRERDYAGAKEKLEACLKTNPYYTPGLTDLAMVLYHSTNYDEALRLAKTALSVDTYDPAANYYYALISLSLGKITDAKDGFDIAALDVQYRSAAYTNLAKIYLRESYFDKAAEYAMKSINYNKYAVDAYQVLAIIYRTQHKSQQAERVLHTLQLYDPLNHFANFERYLWQPTEQNKIHFTGLIRNEMPQETYLELAIWYNSLDRKQEATKVLHLAPHNTEVSYWTAYLENSSWSPDQLRPDLVFPFRTETADVLKALIQKNDYWLLKYHLALIEWSNGNRSSSKQLFEACGNAPDYAPFYAARAKFNMQNDNVANVSADLKQAAQLDKQQWRYGKSLINYYLSQKQYDQALTVATDYRNRFPENYIIGMLYAKTLMNNKKYNEANKLLQTIQILPNEGATDGRQLYKETQLMLALDAMKKKDYDKALQYTAAARLWPENLGVGKPYAEDIDERVEDWLAYENYARLGNDQAAEQMLAHILAFKTYPDENGYVYSSVKDLVSAWALQKKGKSDEAEKLLKRWVEKQPGNNLAKWALNAYNGNYTQLPDEMRTDENYRVLQEWITISRNL